MGKAGTKQSVLLGVFVILLIGLVAGINLLGSRESAAPAAPASQTLPGPTLDPVALAARWPEILAHAAAPARGSVGARYTIAEFGDFQCPQCGKARPQIEKLLAQYPGQVNLIFLHRPFPGIHKWALPAGQASVIAAAQGKFWPIYDVLYSHQDDLEPGFYGDYAAKAGLDKTQFQVAFDAGQGQDKITEDTKFADDLGIQLTPTVLLYNNAAKSIKIYVGLAGTKLPSGSVQYAGINDLTRQPPWTSTAQALPPSPR